MTHDLWLKLNIVRSRAMLIEKKLPECFWEFKQEYAAMIYDSIPPVRTRPGTFPRSPMEKFTGVKCDTSIFKVFGCRAFAYIDKSFSVRG